MRRLRYRILTAMILLCVGNAFGATVWAESNAEITPASETITLEEPSKEIPLPIETQLTNPIKEEADEHGHNETGEAVDAGVSPEDAMENQPAQNTGLESGADVVQEAVPGPDETIVADKNDDPEAQTEETSHSESGQTTADGTLSEDAAENKPENPAEFKPDTDTVSGSPTDENADSETQMTDAVQDPEETVTDAVYADNSNFKSVIQGRPATVIVTETIIWSEEYNETAPENTSFTTDTPVEIVLGEHSIAIEENSRLSFSGPFHFTGNRTLFRIGGDLYIDGVRLTANGDETTAITFSDASIPNGAFTRNLELNNCELSVHGLGGVGVRAAQGAVIRITNTAVLCAGEKSIGVIDTANSTVSVYEHSRFEVMKKNAVGMVLPEQAHGIGFLEFDISVSGENSRGVIVPDGSDYANSGTVAVSGEKAVGIYLEESAYRVETGRIIVTGAESTGIFAEGNLEASQLSLKAETGIAAEADGALTFILCDIDAPPDGLLSHSGEIVLDTCHASDLPDGAKVKMRKAQPYLNHYETPDGERLTYEIGVFGFFVPVGSERLSLPDTLTFSLYDVEDPSVRTIERILPVIWEETEYDPDSIGDYVLSYRAEANGLPIEIAGAVTLHVYDGSLPRLNYAVRLGADHTELHFTPRVDDGQQIRLWVSDDSGETWRDYIAEDKAQGWGRLGFVTTNALKENTAYLLKLEVVGGLHAGISPVLSYWRNEREIRWENGDRDGGDQRPQEERPEPSPVPTPKPNRPGSSGSHGRPGSTITVTPSAETPQPQEPESQPVFIENPREEKPSGGVELTQPELLDIIEANPETVTVVSGDVKAELPTEALENIPLKPEETLSVVLRQPEENAFDIQIYAGEREIDSLGGSPIKVTVPDTGGSKQAVPQEGGAPIPAKETANGEVRFTIPETGTYLIDPPPEKQETEFPDTKLSVWIWLSGALCIGILLFLLWLILRKRRTNL